MEHKINDMVGGKPYAKFDTIDEDLKPEYHTRDIEGYNGKWIIEIGMKDKTNKVSKYKFNSLKEANKAIKEAWKTGLSENGVSIAKPEEISFMIPLPIGKT